MGREGGGEAKKWWKVYFLSIASALIKLQEEKGLRRNHDDEGPEPCRTRYGLFLSAMQGLFGLVKEDRLTKMGSYLVSPNPRSDLLLSKLGKEKKTRKGKSGPACNDDQGFIPSSVLHVEGSHSRPRNNLEGSLTLLPSIWPLINMQRVRRGPERT